MAEECACTTGYEDCCRREPLERMFRVGRTSLSNAELLAVLANITPREADDTLQRVGGLHGLAQASPTVLTQTVGIGRKTAYRIRACTELCDRIAVEKSPPPKTITRPEDAAAALRSMAHLDQEAFYAVYLNARHSILGITEICRGSTDACMLHPVMVFRPAIELGATALILAHNHPSGNLEFSPDDIALGKRMAEAARMVGLRMLDHLLVTKSGVVSSVGSGLLARTGGA